MRIPTIAALALVVAAPAAAQSDTAARAGRYDLGKMWTFENAPAAYFTRTYGFPADSAWFARARLSALRIPGCSAAFVSGRGLIVTNHHCVRGRLALVAREGETLLDSGFVAQGYSMPCFSEREVAEAQARIAMQQALGLDVRWVGPDELDDLNPAMARGMTMGGSYAPGDGYIDPPRNVLAYTAALFTAGVRVVERTGKDLREVSLLVGSGGVLRHNPDGGSVLTRHLRADGGWQLPEDPRAVVDVDYLLAPAGLLVHDHPAAAYALVRSLL